jgi:hypothetical protein
MVREKALLELLSVKIMKHFSHLPDREKAQLSCKKIRFRSTSPSLIKWLMTWSYIAFQLEAGCHFRF